MNKTLIATLIASLFIASPVLAADKFTGKLETCLKAAQAKHAGATVSLEAELDKGTPIYEFDIKVAKGESGKEWEVECNAKTGKITEINLEVADANDPAFKSKAKITEDAAKKIALAVYDGTVVENEYKIEENGDPSFEFDIQTKDGKEFEIEVDAVTSKVVGNQEEVYQIGDD